MCLQTDFTAKLFKCSYITLCINDLDLIITLRNIELHLLVLNENNVLCHLFVSCSLNCGFSLCNRVKHSVKLCFYM